MKQHNGFLSGGAKYTEHRRPVRLYACVVCQDKQSALRLEYKVKQMQRSEKIEFFHGAM